MAGREFSHVAGQQPHGGLAEMAAVERFVAGGTLALPAFGIDSGQFPGAAGRGRIVGPPPVSAAERLALAVLYTALLTVTCADALGAGRRVVLDGSYLGDPLYARLVAALRPSSVTLHNHESYGVAAGASATLRPRNAEKPHQPHTGRTCRTYGVRRSFRLRYTMA